MTRIQHKILYKFRTLVTKEINDDKNCQKIATLLKVILQALIKLQVSRCGQCHQKIS